MIAWYNLDHKLNFELFVGVAASWHYRHEQPEWYYGIIWGNALIQESYRNRTRCYRAGFVKPKTAKSKTVSHLKSIEALSYNTMNRWKSIQTSVCLVFWKHCPRKKPFKQRNIFLCIFNFWILSSQSSCLRQYLSLLFIVSAVESIPAYDKTTYLPSHGNGKKSILGYSFYVSKGVLVVFHKVRSANSIKASIVT